MRRGLQLKDIKVVNKPNGKRYLYRRVGDHLIALPNLPENDPAFLAAYTAAGKVKLAPKVKQRHPEGSIAALCASYLGSHEYRRLADSTRAVWRRTLGHISEQRGVALVKDLRPEHLRKDIRPLSPGSASNRIKAWRSILRFAIDEGWITSDPSIGIRAPKGEVKPHRQWTDAEISGFRAHWPSGTAERLAFEVIYWTGARCVDAVRLGWAMVDEEGWLSYTQMKTKGRATCPIRTLPNWARAIEGDQRHLLAEISGCSQSWISTSAGHTRSVKGLSQWMSAAATTAGLPVDCTAHGLRKARAASLAIVGATASQIGAWTGHASLSEVSHYTRQADQKHILGSAR